jgi:hypothetical protein
MSAKQITAPTITFALVSIIPRIQRSLSRLDDSSLLRPIHSPFILSGGLIRLRTRRVTLVGRGGVARSGRVARSGTMLVFGHCLLLIYCRVVFDALLQGFFMHFFPRFIAHCIHGSWDSATVNRPALPDSQTSRTGYFGFFFVPEDNGTISVIPPQTLCGQETIGTSHSFCGMRCTTVLEPEKRLRYTLCPFCRKARGKIQSVSRKQFRRHLPELRNERTKARE